MVSPIRAISKAEQLFWNCSETSPADFSLSIVVRDCRSLFHLKTAKKSSGSYVVYPGKQAGARWCTWTFFRPMVRAQTQGGTGRRGQAQQLENTEPAHLVVCAQTQGGTRQAGQRTTWKLTQNRRTWRCVPPQGDSRHAGLKDSRCAGCTH